VSVGLEMVTSFGCYYIFKVSPGCCTGQQIMDETCRLAPAAVKHHQMLTN